MDFQEIEVLGISLSFLAIFLYQYWIFYAKFRYSKLWDCLDFAENKSEECKNVFLAKIVVKPSGCQLFCLK